MVQMSSTFISPNLKSFLRIILAAAFAESRMWIRHAVLVLSRLFSNSCQSQAADRVPVTAPN